MSTPVNLDQYKREDARWHILRAIDAGRPNSVGEPLIGRVLGDIGYKMTPQELRRELDYLRDRKLITIKGEDSPTWLCDLTRYGVDIVEYTIDCEPGIARPPRYW